MLFAVPFLVLNIIRIIQGFVLEMEIILYGLTINFFILTFVSYNLIYKTNVFYFSVTFVLCKILVNLLLTSSSIYFYLAYIASSVSQYYMS